MIDTKSNRRNRFGQMSGGQQIAIISGVCFLVFLNLFAAVEMAMRVRAWIKHGQAIVRIEDTYRHDEKTGLRLPRPVFTTPRLTINSLGFRSPEIPIEKPAQTYRIVFLGDSTTYSAEVSGDALIKTLRANKVDLIGEGIQLNGLKTLRLGNVLGGADIHLTTQDEVRISLDQVAGDTTIDIDGTLSRLSADLFIGGTIRADKISKLSLAAVHNGSFETTQGDLENIHVRDGDLNGQVNVAGRLHKITINRGDLNGLTPFLLLKPCSR